MHDVINVDMYVLLVICKINTVFFLILQKDPDCLYNRRLEVASLLEITDVLLK